MLGTLVPRASGLGALFVLENLNVVACHYWQVAVKSPSEQAPVVRSCSRKGARYQYPEHVIEVSDQILARASDRTLRAIVAHEIGHAVAYRNIRRRQNRGLSLVLGLYLAMSVHVFKGLPEFRLEQLLIIGGSILLTGFIKKAFSFLSGNSLQQELQADKFAAMYLGEASAVINAIKEVCEIEGGNMHSREIVARIAALSRS